jgi:hypothetical protein
MCARKAAEDVVGQPWEASGERCNPWTAALEGPELQRPSCDVEESRRRQAVDWAWAASRPTRERWNWLTVTMIQARPSGCRKLPAVTGLFSPGERWLCECGIWQLWLGAKCYFRASAAWSFIHSSLRFLPPTPRRRNLFTAPAPSLRRTPRDPFRRTIACCPARPAANSQQPARQRLTPSTGTGQRAVSRHTLALHHSRYRRPYPSPTRKCSNLQGDVAARFVSRVPG